MTLLMDRASIIGHCSVFGTWYTGCQDRDTNKKHQTQLTIGKRGIEQTKEGPM